MRWSERSASGRFLASDVYLPFARNVLVATIREAPTPSSDLAPKAGSSARLVERLHASLPTRRDPRSSKGERKITTPTRRSHARRQADSRVSRESSSRQSGVSRSDLAEPSSIEPSSTRGRFARLGTRARRGKPRNPEPVCVPSHYIRGGFFHCVECSAELRFASARCS